MGSVVFTPATRIRGFTLIEAMVATAVLVVLLLLLSSLTIETTNVWHYTSSKMEEFSGPRDAFDSMTRQFSQATLNTYWDYDSPTSPTRYVRQSELRFISGPMLNIAGVAPVGKQWVTHGTFFQAPVGFVGSPNTMNPDPSGLTNLLNTWGYFIEFGDDSSVRPAFVTSPPKYRFRLCEFMQPSNSLNLYSFTSGNPGYNQTDWFLPSLNATTNRPVHFLAENVIALVLVPKLSSQEDPTKTKLAPNLIYDSTATSADATINPKNQLPPVVEVTMVAIDEASAVRIANGPTIPNLGLSSLFVSGPSAAANVTTDLQTLQTTLAQKKINFRVFTLNVVIHAARWSVEQSN